MYIVCHRYDNFILGCYICTIYISTRYIEYIISILNMCVSRTARYCIVQPRDQFCLGRILQLGKGHGNDLQGDVYRGILGHWKSRTSLSAFVTSVRHLPRRDQPLYGQRNHLTNDS